MGGRPEMRGRDRRTREEEEEVEDEEEGSDVCRVREAAGQRCWCCRLCRTWRARRRWCGEEEVEAEAEE